MPGDVILHADDHELQFVVVLDGTAVVTEADGARSTVGPGSHIGETALLDHGPQTVRAVARTPVRLLVMTDRDFHAMLHLAPSVTRHLAAVLAVRLRVAQDRPRLHPEGVPRCDRTADRSLEPNTRLIVSS